MTTQEQIDAIKAGLAAIETAIARAQAALSEATTVDEVARLNNLIVNLKAKRTELQLQLLNLQSAAVAVAAPRAAQPRAFTAKESIQGRALTRGLNQAAANQKFVAAALKHATGVSRQVDQLGKLLKRAGPAPRKKPTAGGSRTGKARG
jgi:hypothetical protein